MAQDAEEHQAPAIPFRNTEGEGQLELPLRSRTVTRKSRAETAPCRRTAASPGGRCCGRTPRPLACDLWSSASSPSGLCGRHSSRRKTKG